jgi:hypothetical protein
MKERDERISIDPDSNKIFVPGSGNLPIIGLHRGKLNAAQKKAQRDMVALKAAIMSTWQCTACHQKFPGAEVKVKKGPGETALFVCPECKGAIVVVENALSLVKPPKEMK